MGLGFYCKDFRSFVVTPDPRVYKPPTAAKIVNAHSNVNVNATATATVGDIQSEKAALGPLANICKVLKKLLYPKDINHLFVFSNKVFIYLSILFN